MLKDIPLDRFKRWPLRHQVWPFVLTTLLFGWTALSAQISLERQDAESAAIARAQDRATLLEQHVVKTLQIAAITGLHLGHTYMPPHGPSGHIRPAARHWIDDPSIKIAGVSAVTILDSQGRIVAAYGPSTMRPDPELIAKLRQGSSDGSRLLVSVPHASGNSGHQFIFVTRKIIREGVVTGYVTLSFRPRQFLNFPLNTNFDAKDIVSVITLGGVSLARREGDRFSSGEDLRGGLVMRQQFENPNGSYLGPSTLDGHVRYFSHRRLEAVPIFVTAGVSHSAALMETEQRAAIYLAVMAILSALGLLTAWIIQREAIYRDRKAAELADSTLRLQEAQRVGKIGDWEYDLSRDVMIWSDQLCEMYERAAADDHLTFAEFSAYLLPGEEGKLSEFFQTLMAYGGYNANEFRVRLPSGTISHRCITAVAAVNSRKKVVRLYGTDQDVTERHMVQDLEKQVAHLDRQGAMSMMAGTLAHELNQPLTAASNYVTGVLRAATAHKGYASTPVASGLRLALEQIHGAAEIIRRVRKMVQVETDATKTASIPEAVYNALALLKASGFSNAEEISIEVERDMSDAHIAPIQLQQVLVNLLKNALEAAPAEDPRVSVRATRCDDQFLRIEIQDNGPGFSRPPTDMFTAFETEKENGTGLGLSISRTIVEYHGGKLHIESNEPGKTVLVILIPRVPAGS